MLESASVLTSEEAALLRSAEQHLSGAELAEVERLIALSAADLLSEAEDDDKLTTKIQLDRERTELSQEIGPLPFVVDPVRRESCRYDLRLYALTYFRASCWRGFAPYQEEMIVAFQEVLTTGGKKARAVRRGGLKSTLARIATAWAIDYGHRKFPLLVGATDDKANEHRDNFLDMLKASKEHRQDFPEWTPLMLKRANPKKMLRLGGELLVVTAKDERGTIVFPKIDHVFDRYGNPIVVDASESRVSPYSMQATDVSGLSFVDGAGTTVRPDALIFDDVQTPQSAKSPLMTSKRENSICTTFMGLAGLGEIIAAIMVCTVREEDDLTMRFTDRKLHPDWEGKKFPVLVREPDGVRSKEHWTVYAQKLRDGDTPEQGQELATAYYVEHQPEMDDGGIVSWADDKEDGFVTALQWCMTVSILNPDFFRCELQQQGARPKGNIKQLSAPEILKRLSGIPQGVVPKRASYLTGFVDSQDHVLIWMVCAWTTDMTGWIVDFGTWPDQRRSQWYKNDLSYRLEDQLPDASWEQAFVNAHNKLDAFLLDKQWELEGGGTKQVDLLLKDWSSGKHMRLLEPQILALSRNYQNRVRPAKGFDVKPGGKPIHKYGDSVRDRHVKNCWIERRTENPMHVQVDTNMAKDIASRRLQTIVGAPSAMYLPGDDDSSVGILAEHFTAEKVMDRSLGGVHGLVYVAIPGRDNDFWDCVVGNCVAASMLGCAVPGEAVVKVAARKRATPYVSALNI